MHFVNVSIEGYFGHELRQSSEISSHKTAGRKMDTQNQLCVGTVLITSTAVALTILNQRTKATHESLSSKSVRVGKATGISQM